MHSEPSEGDKLPRVVQDLRDEIKRLKLGNAALTKRVTDLEDRVTELEGP